MGLVGLHLAKVDMVPILSHVFRRDTVLAQTAHGLVSVHPGSCRLANAFLKESERDSSGYG